MVQMFGWSRDEASRASRSKRFRLVVFGSEFGRQDFDDDRAAELRVGGLVNSALSARADLVK